MRIRGEHVALVEYAAWLIIGFDASKGDNSITARRERLGLEISHISFINFYLPIVCYASCLELLLNAVHHTHDALALLQIGIAGFRLHDEDHVTAARYLGGTEIHKAALGHIGTIAQLAAVNINSIIAEQFPKVSRFKNLQDTLIWHSQFHFEGAASFYICQGSSTRSLHSRMTRSNGLRFHDQVQTHGVERRRIDDRTAG